MDQPKPNERKLKRLKMPFVLRLQRLSAMGLWDYVLLADISTTGARFHTEQQYLEGEVLNLRFYLRGDMPAFVCTGEVVRIARLGHMDLFEAAVIFMDLTQENVELVDRAIKDNMTDVPDSDHKRHESPD